MGMFDEIVLNHFGFVVFPDRDVVKWTTKTPSFLGLA
jgi:hypothetical protein